MKEKFRAVVTEIPSDAGDMCHILLDSGADAAVFPTRFAQCGEDPGEGSARLHDAQGNVIPVDTVRDVVGRNWTCDFVERKSSN